MVIDIHKILCVEIFHLVMVNMLIVSISDGGTLRGVMGNELDCDLEVSTVSLYCVHFRINSLRKGMSFLIIPPMG